MYARLRRHWGGIFVAFFIMLLVEAPLIAFPYWAGERYRGINIAQFSSDEYLYLSRGKEVLEGHGLGQVFLSVDKNAPDPTISFVERIILAPVTLLGLGSATNVVTYYNSANAVGVFLTAFLIYAFAYLLSRNRLLGAGVASFVIGGYSIVYNKTLFFTDFNVYGRSPVPYMSAIPLCLSMIFLYRATVLRKGMRDAIFAGCFAGALFYIYFYAWTFALALLGSTGLAYLLLRRWSEFRAVCIAGAVAVLIGSPVLYQFVSSLPMLTDPQMGYFFRPTHTHAPVMSLIGTATAILYILYIYGVRDANTSLLLSRTEPAGSRSDREGAPRSAESKSEVFASRWLRFNRRDDNLVDLPFLAGVILAGWVALNQQIITGVYSQYGHYYWYFIVPLSIIIGTYMLWRLIPARFRFALPALLMLVALINTVGGQYRSFWTATEHKLREQDFAPIVRELKRLPHGDVFVGASGDTYAYLVSIYTDHDFFWWGAATLSLFPRERLEETLLVHLYFNEDARKNPAGFLRAHIASSTASVYKGLYHELEGSASGLEYPDYQKRKDDAHDPAIAPLREEIIGDLAKKYARLLPDATHARALLIERGTRYVLWDQKEFPELDFSALPGLRVIATSTDLVLYTVQ